MKKNIIIILTTIVLIWFCNINILAQTSYLDIGSEIKKYPAVQWLSGQPIEHFDDGKIYIVELWATWCAPCIAQMPHINSLAEKFKNSGVVFIGQNVMESDMEKVKSFIERKKEVMTYSLAFAGGADSDFDKEWLKPTGVSSIPQTFVIKGCRLVWQTTPDKLNDEIIRSLIDGDFSVEKAKEINKRNQAESRQ